MTKATDDSRDWSMPCRNIYQMLDNLFLVFAGNTVKHCQVGAKKVSVSRKVRLTKTVKRLKVAAANVCCQDQRLKRFQSTRPSLRVSEIEIELRLFRSSRTDRLNEYSVASCVNAISIIFATSATGCAIAQDLAAATKLSHSADARSPGVAIVFVNEAFLKLTGYDRLEVIGRNCRFLQGPATNGDDIAQIRLALASASPLKLISSTTKRMAPPFWNRLFIKPVFHNARSHILLDSPLSLRCLATT
ncbi:PAS domain-containing protein [Rhizobium rhizoryzae]